MESFITEIEIDRLYDLYTYKLSLLNNKMVDVSRLLILYGDNGSGKTTLLKLIFNLLSPLPGRGHRTYIARTPFRRLAIKLGKSTRIIAERPKNKLLGSFNLKIQRKTETLFDGLVTVEGDNRVTSANKTNNQYMKVLELLNIDLFYLSDDRNALSSTFENNSEQEFLLIEDDSEMFVKHIRGGKVERALRNEQILDSAIRKLETFLRKEALKGSNEGEANTNNIYAEIIKSIAQAKGSKEKRSVGDINGLQRSLLEIEKRSRAFSAFSLITPLQVKGIVSPFSKAPAATQQIMASVLAPYVNGIKARLDALQEVQKLIEMIVGSLNSFFLNKEISFDLKEGFRIYSRTGDILALDMLSSGERQLLLLFCNTIVARDQASIFIIDEPEISLNIKWQRKLIQTLLDCTKDSAVQFIVATHSLELLARHRSHVLRLDNLSSEVFHSHVY
jgi:energy-coupling factor transporter ATP-binding protein EcfA2